MDYLQILKQYIGLSSKEIAKLTGLKSKHIQKLLKKYNLPRLNQGGQPKEKNGSWKGGRIIDKSGYVLLKANHPQANSLGYVREHRLIMEQHLGRFLNQDEVVHHLNGQRQDNRLKNLELFESNGKHLRKELKGKTPNWTEDGKKKLASYRSFPFWKFSPTYQQKKNDGLK